MAARQAITAHAAVQHLPGLGRVDFHWSESSGPLVGRPRGELVGAPPGKALLETDLALSHICLSPAETLQCHAAWRCPPASRTKERTISGGDNSSASSGEGLTRPRANSERSSSYSVRAGQPTKRASLCGAVGQEKEGSGSTSSLLVRRNRPGSSAVGPLLVLKSKAPPLRGAHVRRSLSQSRLLLGQSERSRSTRRPLTPGDSCSRWGDKN